jgi:drug/metabolite transporter (DMT)-like permease
MVNSKFKAQLAMFLGGVLMGSVGLFVKALSFIPIYAIVSLRGLFGSLILCLVLFIARKSFLIAQTIRELPGLMVGQGIASAATILFYFYSIQNSGYGTAAFLLYTGPIFAVGFMWGFLSRKPGKRELVAFLIALVGIAILTEPWNFNQEFLQSSSGSWGIISGLLSGISLGVLNTTKVALFEKWNTLHPAETDQKTKSDFFYLNLATASMTTLVIFILFFFPSLEYYPALEPLDWLIALGLGLLPTAIAFSLVNYGLQKDHAGDIIIFSYSETIVGALLSAFIDHAFGLALFIGGALILCANIIIITKNKQFNR